KALILSDTYSQNIALAFSEALGSLNCVADSYLIEDNRRPLKEIPEKLEKLLHEKTIVLNIIRAFPNEIPFRIKWIMKVEETKNIKMGHMPGITEEMMFTSVNVNFNKMRLTADRLLSGVENADQIHITTVEGTDITLGVKGRGFISDIGVKEGGMCNIPCGEIYCAPLETETDGVVVFNASIGDIGLLEHPLKVFVREGRIAKFESDDTDLVKRITELTEIDADSKVIGELGIGLNPGAHIKGNMLEDEKTLGTAHIAFGNNEDFPGGGKNRSQIHRDYLFYRPTIEAEYRNRQKKLLIREGSIIHQEFKTLLDF
ncbi:MAG: aminopeptidase, partial [Syntrophothermus sp.]